MGAWLSSAMPAAEDVTALSPVKAAPSTSAHESDGYLSDACGLKVHFVPPTRAPCSVRRAAGHGLLCAEPACAGLGALQAFARSAMMGARSIMLASGITTPRYPQPVCVCRAVPRPWHWHDAIRCPRCCLWPAIPSTVARALLLACVARPSLFLGPSALPMARQPPHGSPRASCFPARRRAFALEATVDAGAAAKGALRGSGIDGARALRRRGRRRAAGRRITHQP